MPHFSSKDWFDFARGLLDSLRQHLMQDHLDQGCAECRNELQMWRNVVQCASHELGFRPPEEAVRAAKAAFIAERPPWAWLTQMAQMARLVFDSLQSPSTATVRGPWSVRQLVHEAEPFVIDLRLESDPARRRISLAGQVLNSKDPEQRMEGVDVVLLSGDHLVAKTLANDSGEFDLGFSTDEQLRLFINIRGRRAIGIVLPDPEG
jgi:hypothetical protein